MFLATKEWLYDRLEVESSSEKSRIVNLKRKYLELKDLR